jgi:hypothetical protein
VEERSSEATLRLLLAILPIKKFVPTYFDLNSLSHHNPQDQIVNRYLREAWSFKLASMWATLLLTALKIFL